MEIRDKGSYYLLKTSSAKVAISKNEESPLKLKDEVDLVINNFTNSIYSIKTPGEYEVKSVFVIAHGIEKLCYILVVEEVNVLFIDPSMQLGEADLDLIGQIDVLALVGEYEINSELVKFINKIDPQVLITDGATKDRSEDFNKFFGIPVDNKEGKYKFASSDFDNEEYKLQIIDLK